MEIEVSHQSLCRLREYQVETLHHLLEDCAKTNQYQDKHNISSKSLVCKTHSSMLEISEYGIWLRSIMNYDAKPPKYRIQLAIANA